jgi:hypothetical protein
MHGQAYVILKAPYPALNPLSSHPIAFAAGLFFQPKEIFDLPMAL